MSFYPQGDAVYLDAGDTQPVQTDVLAATTDGSHILGASLINGGVELSDIGEAIPSSVSSPTGDCGMTTTGTGASQVQTLQALTIAHQVNQTPLAQVNGPAVTQINQVIPSPVSNLAFITYDASDTNFNAVLPYYKPVACSAGSTTSPCTLGTVGYVTLTGASANSGPTAPIAGAFTPDDTLFFVSTAGDNLIHYISLPSLTDTQQIAPGLPACTPGVNIGCTFTGTGTVVPATAIVVKPRTTT
jgi:hypothetical protein